MLSEDDFNYAMETTRVLHEPDRRIDTFGATRFEFQLVSELMDSVNQVRVRAGSIEADRPRILRPEPGHDFNFEGFGPGAGQFGDWLRDNAAHIAFLKYGFQFKRGEVSEDIVHESMEQVCDRIIGDVESVGNPLMAVIAGVDDAWEVCLLKFTIEMAAKSQGVNIFDFKRRGLL